MLKKKSPSPATKPVPNFAMDSLITFLRFS